MVNLTNIFYLSITLYNKLIFKFQCQTMFCKTIEREKGRKLYLYSSQKREYKEIKGLPSLDKKSQHLRWNSLRNEWVFYSPVRQERTFLPNASNCPLCPSQKDGMRTDIPVSDYEIAVFDNRF